MAMDRTTDRLLKIINSVRSQECLWNVRSPDYAKRDKLEKAWMEVSRVVGQSDVYCREKWRNVRTGFLRSIQNNIRIVPDESSNDFQAVRRKRFYLYDNMKFLLPSVHLLEEARRHKRLSKKLGGDENCLNDEGSDHTIRDYTTLVRKFDTNSECEITLDRKQEDDKEIESQYEQIFVELEKDKTAADEIESDNDEQPSFKKLCTDPVNNDAGNLGRSVAETKYHQSYGERDFHHMLDFFRSNIDDILALPKKYQRMFKRRVLDLIEELHGMEEGAKN